MNYITRNHKFDINDNKAFEIYSDSTCEELEFTCNYDDMITVIEENINIMVNDGLLDYREAWEMRNDYIMYDETIDMLENGGY